MAFLFYIPARGGSKGIVDKNLQKIGKKSLVEIAVKFMCDSGFKDSTVLSSDSDKILEVGRAQEILCDKRSKSLASDKTTTAASIKEFIESDRLKNKLNKDDWVIIVEPTSPFRRQQTLLKLLKLIESDKFDSIFTTYSSSSVEWIAKEELWIRKDNVNGSLSRRQSRPAKYFECGVFYATKVKNITSESIIGNNSHCIIVDDIEALDVNSPLDLEICRTVFNQLNKA
tara:strand:- start:1360 stop:2043 length:684 start_codon:yes stop_codon:yes gene_type:complete